MDDQRGKPAGTVGRRGFLKGAAIGGVSAVALPLASVEAAPPPPVEPNPADPRPARPVPDPDAAVHRPDEEKYESSGGDYIVDVMRSLGIEYFAATPGNTFLGVHEAVVNYGMLTEPKLDFISTLHEEASVAMAHGYAKIEGKPMACMMHTAVGLQHASMAIYNAWADRVPVFMMMGHSFDTTTRGFATNWHHAALDGAAMVRDFTKWDDTPANLRAFGESAVRAYKFSMTPPFGPTLISVDTVMQEQPIPGGTPPPIPHFPKFSAPTGEPGAVREAAAMLVAAENPVIFADRYARTPAGIGLLVELAELLQAGVVAGNGRMNFPWRHPLNQTQRQARLIRQADVLLELEPIDPTAATMTTDAAGAMHPLMKPGTKRISISSVDLYMKSNYQDFMRYASDVDLSIPADAEATMPMLIAEVKRQLRAEQRAAIEKRGQAHAAAHAEDFEESRKAAVYGWDSSPISMPRLCMELYDQIKDDDWSLVSNSNFQSRWPQRLWSADKSYQYIGSQGGGGVGYMAPAGLGAALANRKYGRLSVCICGDGDLMMGPGILWTAAHEKIPILYIVHNNRAYHEEVMQLLKVANRRNRGFGRAGIGTEITNPNIDYASVARGLGVYSEGPIEKPSDLRGALHRALAVVRRGEPALLDVVSQGR